VDLRAEFGEREREIDRMQNGLERMGI